jgi:hypothetical protein
MQAKNNASTGAGQRLHAFRGEGGSGADYLEVEFRRNVTHLHALGPGAVGELLAELGARFLICTEIETLLRRYRRLDLITVVLIGARY